MALELRHFILGSVGKDPSRTQHSYCFYSKKKNKVYNCPVWQMYIRFAEVTPNFSFSGCFEDMNGRIKDFRYDAREDVIEMLGMETRVEGNDNMGIAKYLIDTIREVRDKLKSGDLPKGRIQTGSLAITGIVVVIKCWDMNWIISSCINIHEFRISWIRTRHFWHLAV